MRGSGRLSTARRSSCALGVLSAAFAAAYPTAGTAQGPDGNRVVRGVVRDSLNGGAVIRGATLRIAALGLQALTDQRARFECRSLSPERHELSVHSALLDSLGIDTLPSTVAEASRRNADWCWRRHPVAATPRSCAAARCRRISGSFVVGFRQRSLGSHSPPLPVRCCRSRHSGRKRSWAPVKWNVARRRHRPPRCAPAPRTRSPENSLVVSPQMGSSLCSDRRIRSN